jgi:hypothetical protein
MLLAIPELVYMPNNHSAEGGHRPTFSHSGTPLASSVWSFEVHNGDASSLCLCSSYSCVRWCHRSLQNNLISSWFLTLHTPYPNLWHYTPFGITASLHRLACWWYYRNVAGSRYVPSSVYLRLVAANRRIWLLGIISAREWRTYVYSP